MEDIIEQYKGKILPVVIPPPMYYSIFAADKLSMIMLWIGNPFLDKITPNKKLL